jgi:signal transduction histidine kinase/DNA-binding response OmpR family regulator
MPGYSAFIRSIRIRYLSGLLVFALASAIAMLALDHYNTLRHDVDGLGSGLVELTHDLQNAANFTETSQKAWRPETHDELAKAAGKHAQKLTREIGKLSRQVTSVSPRLSKRARDELNSASISGDLFWSARDMVRNLEHMAVAYKVDEWSAREIANQNDLFAQPLLARARTALNDERHLADAASDRVLKWSSLLIFLVLAAVAIWIFRPMERMIRRAFEEVAEALSRAEAADRAKSEFLANMSHEIRTPMNGVLGMAELLDRTELTPRQKTFTDVIVKSGNALLTIINDILDFTKINAGQLKLDPAPFGLAEAVEDVATLISARVAEKNLELVVRVDPHLPAFVIGDAGRFRQIITNLLGNAVKFTEKGHVLIDVTGETVDGVAHLRVSVEDTGIGIPVDKLQNVFEKFAQVDSSSTRRHEGTGLGLAIAARLVDLMGGRIGVESEVGRGSVFWFTTPLPVQKVQSGNTAVPSDVTGARVLVIDDNSVNRDILLEQLRSWSFDCAAAESGTVGLAFLDRAMQLGASVDCIILDYQMPGMNGADVAKVIAADRRLVGIPVVLLTSVDQVDFNKLMLDFGIAAHLTKPARSSILLGTIISAIQKARSQGCVTHLVREPTPAVQIADLTARRGQTPSPADGESLNHAGMPIDILVAEDNEVNQLVFAQILNGLALSYRIAGNGRTALEMYRSLDPKLILMDISMPELNGYEATRAIRAEEAQRGSHIPIIGVTAHALKSDREKCLEAGMDDYLPKPISPDRLGAKIGNWLGEAAKAKSA